MINVFLLYNLNHSSKLYVFVTIQDISSASKVRTFNGSFGSEAGCPLKTEGLAWQGSLLSEGTAPIATTLENWIILTQIFHWT